MKTVVRQMPCLKITIKTTFGQGHNWSKSCRRAYAAAEFYAGIKNLEWWKTVGHLTQRPDRYTEKDARYDRLYRRALRVFKQYLP